MPGKKTSLALVATALCLSAAPVAAQDLSNAEIEDYIEDRCRHLGVRYRNLDLAMELPDNFREPTQRLRRRLPRYWENGGYLLVSEREHGGASHNFAVPLSSVDIWDQGEDTIRFACLDDLTCIFRQTGREAESRRHMNRYYLRCRVRDRVVRAFETWIDRNVTRMTWEDPFAD